MIDVLFQPNHDFLSAGRIVGAVFVEVVHFYMIFLGKTRRKSSRRTGLLYLFFGGPVLGLSSRWMEGVTGEKVYQIPRSTQRLWCS